MPAAGWTKMSDEEIRLAKKWYEEDNLAPSDIADRLGRNKSNVTRLLVLQAPRKKQGAPKKLTKAKVDFLVNRLDELVVKADCKYTVTVKLLKRSTRVKASERTILGALHERNIYFRRLREKPALTPEDVADRLKFANKYRYKTQAWWNKHVHGFIDGKFFQVYLNGESRVRAAQHATYGAYRSPGKGLSGGYVKPKKSLKFNTGAPSTLVMAGVGQGRVFMWHSVPGARWNGQAAANMYTGSLKTALEKAWPEKRKWSVLEDNDPTGFKSNKGKSAKAGAGIVPFQIPKRSPDLSLCDYSLWTEVNKRMRRQERKWPKGKRESRDGYMARLKRTAFRLPKSFVEKSIGDMRRRCRLLLAAKGHHFE
jgi:transposase